MSIKASPTVAVLLSIFWVATLHGGESRRASTKAISHLNEIVSVLEQKWLYRDRMDWTTFREQVLAEGRGAQSISDTYDAIGVALSLLGDKHSHYVTASGDIIYNPESPTHSTGECIAPPFVLPLIPTDIGYVRIQITPATSKETIQKAIRRGAGANVIGWIVDLRNSRGGNMWPALAGIGSLLGEGVAGFFIDGSGEATPWGYRNGIAWLGEHDIETVESPIQLNDPSARVAVLTDVGVASSGEAIAIAFRGRLNTRSFGTPTCGLSTAVRQFPLTNGARIAVVGGVMADRTGRQYGEVVEPDELIRDPDDVVPRAIAWLRGD